MGVKKVIIVGGGVAGLSAAVSLLNRGFQVLLLERRPFLGGRIYSYREPATGDFVDNGQHLFAGFYDQTFKFLSLIGSSDHIARQERLSIDFVSEGGEIRRFQCPALPSPFHFLAGLLFFLPFPKTDILRLIVRHRRLKRPIDGESADDLLNQLGQSKRARDSFFHPLVLATLNAGLDEVSGELLRGMLNRILSVPANQGVLAYSTVGFSELIAKPAADYIRRNRGEIRTSCRVERIEISDHMVRGVVDRHGGMHRADAYILALPPDCLARLLPAPYVGGLGRWTYTPIVSVNLWYDRPVTDQLMLGITDGHFHWIFDKQAIIRDPEVHRYVTLLKSAAYDEIGMKRDPIIQMAKDDMRRYCPRSQEARLQYAQVIRERHATVLISPSLGNERPDIVTQWPNLFVAGDWVDTGLPATVESAAKSGFEAADCVARGRFA